MADLAWWQTLVSGAAGGALTLLGQERITRHQIAHQRQQRAEERDTARSDRREAFELQHLTALRDLLTKVFRNTMVRSSTEPEMHALDVASLRAEMALALDEEVRRAAREAYDKVSLFDWEDPETPASTLAMAAAGRSISKTQRLIGDRIRTLYGTDPEA
jgi:hypothetical protein